MRLIEIQEADTIVGVCHAKTDSIGRVIEFATVHTFHNWKDHGVYIPCPESADCQHTVLFRSDFDPPQSLLEKLREPLPDRGGFVRIGLVGHTVAVSAIAKTEGEVEKFDCPSIVIGFPSERQPTKADFKAILKRLTEFFKENNLSQDETRIAVTSMSAQIITRVLEKRSR